MESEAWKLIIMNDIKFNYEISNKGNVRHKDTRVVLGLNKKENEYIKHKFYVGKKGSTYGLHTLVATMFIENPNNYICVKHKNGNKHDNQIENLEWTTNSEAVQKTVSTRIYNGKPIEQYSEDGKTFIKRFNSVRDASKELDINEKNFSSVLSGRTKTTGGFHFKYASSQPITDLSNFETIDNFSDYKLDRNGNIYNLKTDTFVQSQINNGFKQVWLNRKRQYVHRLLAIQYIPNSNNKLEVNHINGNKLDNNLTNLEWK